jgi:hypothetical protein
MSCAISVSIVPEQTALIRISRGAYSTPARHMSVQVMYRNPPSAASAGQVQYSQGGYDASVGRYEIDERARSFNYHVEGALVRNLVGQVQTRLYELSGKQLVVESSNPNEHWRVGWEHY